MSRSILEGVGHAQYGRPVPNIPGQSQYARPVPSPPGVGQGQYTAPNPPTNQSHGGYTPVQYDNAHGGPDPQQFYGMLIDASHRPSEVWCRLVDSLFFYIDQNSEVFRNTQHIEPAKYGWFMRSIGLDSLTVSVCEKLLTPLYDAASIPYTIQNINGSQVPVLDRRGWLHLSVFEAIASPVDTHKHWSKMLNMLHLSDPASNTPFPTPLPRFALPAAADFALNQVYTNWQIQLVTAVTQQRTQATISQYTNAATMRYAGLGAILGGGGLGVGSSGQDAAGLGAFAGLGGGQPQDAQTLEMLQKIESDKKKTSMINAGVSILSTVMGAGPVGGFGN